MKVWEYEALRNTRDAIARTIAEEIADMLHEHVDLLAEKLVRERYGLDKPKSVDQTEARQP